MTLTLKSSAAAVALAGFACTVGPEGLPPDDGFEERSLAPVTDFREPDYIERARPKGIELSADGSILFVSLAGDLQVPGNTVLALEPDSGAVLATIEVGASPQGMALASDGALLYVANQFSNHISVIDVESRTVVGTIPVSYYAQDLVVDPEGSTLYVTNRWLDAVEIIELDEDGRGGRVDGQIRTPTNPRDVAIGPDGRLYVGSISGTSLSILDPSSRSEIDRIHLNAPVNGVAIDGDRVFLATLGRGDGHPAEVGTDAERGVTYRGDGTAALAFSDINNDVAVIDITQTGGLVARRYTSDTAEVSARDVIGDYSPEEMVVAGAFPEQAVVRGGRLFVTMSSSDSVQVFDMGAGGALIPTAVLDTGLNPFELAVTGDGAVVYTADRLGDTVSRIEVATNERVQFAVGDSSAPAYPGNAYEVGEMLFNSARMSAEGAPSPVHPEGDKTGDMSCNHCHVEGLTDGKVWSVGIGEVVALGGQRLAPAARNLLDTPPFFWEGTQDEFGFDLEGNGFAPAEDFGCDREETEADPDSCAARDEFFVAKTGYDFGTVFTEFFPVYLIGRPRLYPNPLAQDPDPEAAEAIARGRELFFSAAVGCATCHPANGDDRATPFTVNQNLPPVIPDSGLDNGVQFKDEIDGNFNVPSLRGVWDRPAVFFHDGRAKSLRAAILASGHPALVAGEDGCHLLAEEVDQFADGLPRPVHNGGGCNGDQLHGATADLSSAEVDDLLMFVRSIE